MKGNRYMDQQQNPPHSWESFFDRMRSVLVRKASDLGLEQLTRASLGRLDRELEREREFVGFAKRSNPGWLLGYGIPFGDFLIKRFGGHWHYSAWTPGTITQKQLEGHSVVLRGIASAQPPTVWPMRRVHKYAFDPQYTFTGLYDSLEAIEAGRLDLTSLLSLGQEIEIGHGTVVKIDESGRR
jgi:hypothetical protein